MDFFSPVLKWIDHNRWLTVGIVLSVVVCSWGFGCESMTKSLSGEDDVDRARFTAEIADVQAGLERDAVALQAKHEAEIATLEAAVKSGEAKIAIGLDDLNQQDEQRQRIFEFVGSLVTAAAAGTVNPATLIAGAVPIVATLVGGGAVIDNRRKDKVITTIKNGTGDSA